MKRTLIPSRIPSIARGGGVRRRVQHSWLVSIFVLALIPCLAAAFPSQSQNSPKPDLTSVVKVVNVLATVRNKKGEIVKNLTKDDFVLAEDDHPQDIKYFLQENDLPETIGLLVDTSLSQRRVLSSERTASYDFLDHVLRQDKDRACVIHFDHQVEMLPGP